VFYNNFRIFYLNKNMDKKTFKNYGIILMILAGIVFIGLMSYWTFSTWKIIDWGVIICCGFIGYKLYKENK